MHYKILTSLQEIRFCHSVSFHCTNMQLQLLLICFLFTFVSAYKEDKCGILQYSECSKMILKSIGAYSEGDEGRRVKCRLIYDAIECFQNYEAECEHETFPSDHYQLLQTQYMYLQQHHCIPETSISNAPALAEDKCDVEKYVECMEPIHNATFGHPHGLFQNSEDLLVTCPVIKNGIECIEKYTVECGTEMIAENYHDQFEKPAEFLRKICDPQSSLRKEYLKASPCMLENSEDLEICSTKVQEFLAFHEADTPEKELTMTCMFEMMLRACMMSTGAEKCGMETAGFIRKALLYSPSLGLQTCSKE